MINLADINMIVTAESQILIRMVEAIAMIHRGLIESVKEIYPTKNFVILWTTDATTADQPITR